MSPVSRQALLTVALLPIMFGLWYAAGNLLAGPAVWLVDVLLTTWLPDAVDSARLNGTDMIVMTGFGELNGTVVSAQSAGEQLGFKVNTRLVSYAMPFYAALLWASNVDAPMERFARGLVLIWLAMALGLAAITAKDLMLVAGPAFLGMDRVPHPNVIGVSYQFAVLLMPSLLPVALWVAQLRGSPLWDQLNERLFPSAGG